MKAAYQSRTWQAAMIIIAIAILRMFGFIGTNGGPTATIPQMIDEPQPAPDKNPINIDTLIDAALAAMGFMAIKGRQQATEPIAPLLGGQTK